ncbi:MAG: OmpA family protein [Endomicrobium sp.]|jgi:outer membrane protein OmpA-like peptidoglycan-associated protein|nr:OmpA family protein [Endomicrobium sp.]
MNKIHKQTSKILITIISCLVFANLSYADLSLTDFIALNDNADLIFSKIKKAGSDIGGDKIVNSIWAQGYMNNAEFRKKYFDNEKHGVKSNRVGGNIGINLLTSKDSIFGFYLGNNETKFDIEKNGGDYTPNMNEIEIGVYYGSFGGLLSSKFLLAYGYQHFRFQDFDFTGHGAKLGYDGEGVIPISKSIDFKPFIQLQGIGVYNEKIKDSINGDAFPSQITYKGKGIIGVRLADDKSDFNWNIGIYGGYRLLGYVQVDAESVSISTNTNIDDALKSGSEGEFIYGASLGAEYVFGIITVFAGGGIETINEDNVVEYYANGGVRFLFGAVKKSEDKKKDEAAKNDDASSPKDADKTAAEIGAKEPENLSNALIAQEKAATQIGAQSPIENPAAVAVIGGVTTPVDSSSNYPVENPQAANQRPIPVVELNDDALLLKKSQDDKQRYANLIKSFILSVSVFQPGGYELTKDAKQEIKALSDNIKRYDYSKITIEGHTDSSGNPAQNHKISELRARSVFGELFINGIPLEKMEYVGFGDTMPISSNNTASGRARNRRVEIFVE